MEDRRRGVPFSRYAVFGTIAVAGCAADLLTKHWIFERLGYPPRRVDWLWQGVLSLETSLNEGALFGIGQGLIWLFATLSIVAALGIVIWLFYARAAMDWLLTIALGMVTAGIFGNLYDRLGFPRLRWPYPTATGRVKGDAVYAVRDWIHFQTPWFDWPIFNLADSFLVCGAGLLMWHAFRQDRAQPKAAESNAGSESLAARSSV